MKNKLLSVATIVGALITSSAMATEVKSQNAKMPQPLVMKSGNKMMNRVPGPWMNSVNEMNIVTFRDMDTNKDGCISSCEAKSFLMMEFTRLDVNKDDVLDEMEVSRINRMPGINCPMMDKNSPKKMNRKNYMMQQMQNMDEVNPTYMFTMLPPRSPLFAKLDSNNDGVVCKKEFVKEGMNSFKALDKDMNKKIYQVEFNVNLMNDKKPMKVLGNFQKIK